MRKLFSDTFQDVTPAVDIKASNGIDFCQPLSDADISKVSKNVVYAAFHHTPKQFWNIIENLKLVCETQKCDVTHLENIRAVSFRFHDRKVYDITIGGMKKKRVG